MRTYRLYQVDAFTTEKFAGNRAGVLPDASGLSDGEMQAIAREINNSETAFILPVGVVWLGSDYSIEMTQARPEFAEPCADADRAELIAALGIAGSDLDERCPVQIVSTGHSEVMIGIRSLESLHAMQPARRLPRPPPAGRPGRWLTDLPRPAGRGARAAGNARDHGRGGWNDTDRGSGFGTHGVGFPHRTQSINNPSGETS